MSGHRNFKELVAKMSPERRARVKAEADELYREYVLSQIRQQVGFTQADVAERLGVSQPTYAECERGSNMRIGTLQKIEKTNDRIHHLHKGKGLHLPLRRLHRTHQDAHFQREDGEGEIARSPLLSSRGRPIIRASRDKTDGRT